MSLKPTGKFTYPNKNNESESDENKVEYSHRNKSDKKSKPNKKKTTRPRVDTSLIAGVLTGPSLRQTQPSVSLVPVVPTLIPVTTLTPYYPYSCSSTTYPIVNEWTGAPAIHNPVYNASYSSPVIITPPVIAPIYSYTGSFVTRPMLSPAVAQPVIIEELPANYGYDVANLSLEQTVPDSNVALQSLSEESLYETQKIGRRRLDPVECYLSLPRHLFPTARMLTLDPNPIIDQFCSLVNIHRHAPWILDLEFGVPRLPITRPIATYDVKFNSVHCKNTPNAIHPGFESCSQEFKQVLLFYYDCIVSSWYKGYIHMKRDSSVENFQSWMHLPMQVLGMCWP